MRYNRNRLTYLLLIIFVILLGLSSRRFSLYLPALLNNYLGDVLWALMVYLTFGFIFKKQSWQAVGILALIFSFSIETSQLYHAPWIDEIRKTRVGGLILGFGFLTSDLASYLAGILIGIFLEKMFFYKLER